MSRNPALTALTIITVAGLVLGTVLYVFGLMLASSGDMRFAGPTAVLTALGLIGLGVGGSALFFALTAHAIVRAIKDKEV